MPNPSNPPPSGLDAEAHNAWVQELIDDVEFEPLKEFLERLKEPISKEPA